MNIDNYSKWFILALVVMASGAWYQAEAAYTPASTTPIYFAGANELRNNSYATNTWTLSSVAFAAYQSGGCLLNDPAAVGAKLGFVIYSPDTTSVTLKVLATQDSDQGRMQINVGGVNTSEIDFYSSLLTRSVYFTQAITLPQTGINTINLTMGAKNPSSSGQGACIQALVIEK